MRVDSDRQKIVELLQHSLHGFRMNLFPRVSKIVLSPPLWMRFVWAFHHRCAPDDLVREMRDPRMMEDLRSMQFLGIPVVLSETVTWPEVVVVGEYGFEQYAQTIADSDEKVRESP